MSFRVTLLVYLLAISLACSSGATLWEALKDKSTFNMVFCEKCKHEATAQLLQQYRNCFETDLPILADIGKDLPTDPTQCVKKAMDTSFPIIGADETKVMNVVSNCFRKAEWDLSYDQCYDKSTIN